MLLSIVAVPYFALFLMVASDRVMAALKWSAWRFCNGRRLGADKQMWLIGAVSFGFVLSVGCA